MVIFEHVDKAGVAHDQGAGKIDNAIQHHMQGIGSHAAANLVNKIKPHRARSSGLRCSGISFAQERADGRGRRIRRNMQRRRRSLLFQ
jgi:hypothetical protein